MKKLVICSIFLSLVLHCTLHGEEINQTTHGENSPAIFGTTGNVTINYGAKREQDEHIKFKGSWNEKKAFSVVWPNPRKAEGQGGHGDKLEKSFFHTYQRDRLSYYSHLILWI